MSADSPAAVQVTAPRRPLWASRRLILITGVFVLPVVIGVLTNSWGPLTEKSAIRMAFGSVAGQTIAILSAIAAVVVAIAFRAPWASVVAIAVVAAFIIALALGNIGQAAELLQERLDTVAELSIRFG